MRIAVYVQASTSHQVLLETIAQLLEQIRSYLATQGWNVANEHIFRDDGYSGVTLKRPGLGGLRDKVHNREVIVSS